MAADINMACRDDVSARKQPEGVLGVVVLMERRYGKSEVPKDKMKGWIGEGKIA